MTQIIIPTWLVVSILVYFSLNALERIVRYFFTPKKNKIVLTYKEFKDFESKIKFKDKIND